MENDAAPHQRTELRREADRLRTLEQALHDRDETIRLLNEALSRALADLERVQRKQVA